MDADCDGSVDRVVERRVCAAGEAHVGNSKIACLVLIDHPVDALDDVGGRSRVRAVEHSDGHDGDALSHTVGLGPNQASGDGAVTGAVLGAG